MGKYLIELMRNRTNLWERKGQATEDGNGKWKGKATEEGKVKGMGNTKGKAVIGPTLGGES